MGRKLGFSFSPSRALGISSAKNKISRAIGVPLTKQGRQRKVGNMMGCSVSFFFFLLLITISSYSLIKVLF